MLRAAWRNRRVRRRRSPKRRRRGRAFPVELTYVFVVRYSDAWSFYVISRVDLAMIRNKLETAPKGGRAGRPAKAVGEKMTLTLRIAEEDDTAWGTSVRKYKNDWRAWPPIKDGPGSRS